MHDRREQARPRGRTESLCNPIACLLDVLHRGPHVHDSRYMKTIAHTANVSCPPLDRKCICEKSSDHRSSAFTMGPQDRKEAL